MEDVPSIPDDETEEVFEKLWLGAPELCRPKALLSLEPSRYRHRIIACGKMAARVESAAERVLSGRSTLEESYADIAYSACEDCPLTLEGNVNEG